MRSPLILMPFLAAGLTGPACTSVNPAGDLADHGHDMAGQASGDMAGRTTGDMAGPPSPDMAGPPGMPITAPPEQWTWVPFSDAFCGNGSATGIGVNLTTQSDRVLIYLEGGGACWSELTCYTLMTASYFTTGYKESDFNTEVADKTYLSLPGGFFDRTAAQNPFKDYSYIYVPYCTGDVHSGDNVVKYGSHTAMHVGYANLTAFLRRIVPTFPAADRVYIAGSSAGGFGAAFNWWRVQQAFGPIRVDLIDDSGTPMPQDILQADSGALATEMAERTNWNLAATLPAGCTACAQSLDAIFDFTATAFPNQRGALLSYEMDSVLPVFFGITEAQFEAGLAEEEKTQFDPHPNLHYFVVGASGHVLFFDPALSTNGTSVQTWLTQMVTDDAAWTSEAP